MPTPVAEARANANAVQGGQGQFPLPTAVNGRLTGLPLYLLDYGILVQRYLRIGEVIRGMGPHSSDRRTDHNDDLGNLPFAPTPGYPVCEFHVGNNGLPHPSHLRIVYDSYRRIVYLTPCHYDPWQDVANTSRNPFYIVAQAPMPQALRF